MKKKFSKSRKIGFAAACLAAVSTVGVGFATWVVQGFTYNNQEQNITVEVGEVVDKRVTLTVSASDNKVAFEPQSTDTSTPIQYDGANAEDLEFSISVAYKSEVATNIKLTAAIKDYSTTDGIGKAVADNYITLPEVTKDSETNAISGDNTNGTWTLVDSLAVTSTETTNAFKFAFDWGNEFGEMNPAKYSGQTDANVDDIVTNLNTLHDLNVTSFTIVISADYVTTTA